YKMGNYSGSLELFRSVLPAIKEMGDVKSLATSLNEIGLIEIKRENFSAALKYLEKALRLRVDSGDIEGEGISVNSIGFIYFNKCDYTKARKYFTRSLKIREEIGNLIGQAYSLHNLGSIDDVFGDYNQAKSRKKRSYVIFKQIGNPSGESHTLNSLGVLEMDWGNYASAERYFRKSLALARKLGIKDLQRRTLLNISELYLLMFDPVKAKVELEQVELLTKEVNSKMAALAYAMLSIRLEVFAQGLNSKISKEFNEVISEFDSLGKPLLTGAAHYNLAWAAFNSQAGSSQRGDLYRISLQKAEKIFKRIKAKKWLDKLAAIRLVD
ncbi:tetratricopeptide repeat protein, partial [Candidatus Calescamantes bacterium]|nr:tetratricopeptide repeat protein [Candidatus Calescamantes bacterium]